jgi:DNA-binding response OmpR family regulator
VLKCFFCNQLFPGSSMVEHSAVNRRVASSNLARGAKHFHFLLALPINHSVREGCAPPVGRGCLCASFSDLPYDTGMRLLLVEDDSRIAHFVARGLKEQSYAVDVAGNGNDALYQIEINDYDVVILDVMIPGQDGFAVCRSIRSLGKHMPVLMLTARDAVDDRIRGLDSGADDYLTKPFEFGELLARLRALLRRPKDLLPSRIAVGDLELDTAAQTARRGNRSIPLTAKEYALLEFLARNADRVVGRSEIAEHVWNESFDPFSNLIEVYVNRLRRKLAEEDGLPLLQTRRGIGYMLCTAPRTESLQRRKTETTASRGPRKPDA